MISDIICIVDKSYSFRGYNSKMQLVSFYYLQLLYDVKGGHFQCNLMFSVDMSLLPENALEL